MPPDSEPEELPGYTDQVVKLGFFVRLENKKLGWDTFSGLARDEVGYYLFWALGDYFSERIGEALNKFLSERVYPDLPGNTGTDGCLVEWYEEKNNVEYQLQNFIGLDPESPLYYSAKITVATY